MAELADALDSGSSGLTALEVRVLFRAPLIFKALRCLRPRRSLATICRVLVLVSVAFSASLPPHATGLPGWEYFRVVSSRSWSKSVCPARKGNPAMTRRLAKVCPRSCPPEIVNSHHFHNILKPSTPIAVPWPLQSRHTSPHLRVHAVSPTQRGCGVDLYASKFAVFAPGNTCLRNTLALREKPFGPVSFRARKVFCAFRSRRRE
jgi:hypothetical protein